MSQHQDPKQADQLFDRYADEYQTLLSRSIRLSGESAEYFVRYKLARIQGLWGVRPPTHIIDVGCGVGFLTELIGRTFPTIRVTGLDLSTKSLELATARCENLTNVAFHLYDGTRLPAEVARADMVVLANVLHHMAPEARLGFLRGVALPALLPGGRIVVFEHNPYNPITRRAVQLCPFDQDARLLTLSEAVRLLRRAQLRVLQRVYIVFFPRPLRCLRGLEGYLGWLPLGAQYMVVGNSAGQDR